MWLLLVPLAILVALAISAAVVATVFSILWAVWPWLLIGAGVWLLVGTAIVAGLILMMLRER